MATLSNIATWFLVFLTYSCIGWVMEVIVSINMHRRPSNRGFLIGPLCPIYGFGALIMTFLLRHTDNIFEIFIVSVGAASILEYTTSYVMEKLFHVRWWDYSHEKFNLNGRICLKMLLAFGAMGVIVTRITNPILIGLFTSIDETGRIAIAATLFCLVLTDIIVTSWLIVGCRATANTLQRDATDEITANIREILMDQGKLRRRLANAFPNMTLQHKTSSKSGQPHRASSKTRPTHPK